MLLNVSQRPRSTRHDALCVAAFEESGCYLGGAKIFRAGDVMIMDEQKWIHVNSGKCIPIQGIPRVKGAQNKTIQDLRAVKPASLAYTKSYIFPTTDKSNVCLRALVLACHGAFLNRGTHCMYIPGTRFVVVYVNLSQP